nr:MAG TPA: hypothetical protein [Caudoviricetes sp.]DAQ66604.1 MAG TPA: hypothetical protein [Caudoviricetes sp.]DAR80044.1 MAG TPA: hypothetical protein [Caudoviricetes sp.]
MIFYLCRCVRPRACCGLNSVAGSFFIVISWQWISGLWQR